MKDITERLYYYCKGDEEAFKFLCLFFRLVHFVDDAYDKDRDVPEAETYQALLDVFFGLPNNKFYLEHKAELEPILWAYVDSWVTSNQMEKLGETGLNLSYGLKEAALGMCGQVARILGGVGWMFEVSSDLACFTVENVRSLEAHHRGERDA